MTLPASVYNSLDAFRSEEGGVLLVDKPLEWTSFDVVKKIRGMLRLRKVGHAGTLDPLATGLLILASQQYTRRLDAFQALEKHYSGCCAFGAVTASYDAAMPPEQPLPIAHLDLKSICEAAEAYIGEIAQVPPMFSAVKVQGKRLYSLARKGAEVERTPRQVTISEFRIVSYDAPHARFEVRCSKGTYVRSLIHDLGQALGCGAYLTELRRDAIGAFRVDEAWTIEEISSAVASQVPEEVRRPAGARV